MNVRKSPCDECAFSRSCEPGLLGGSPVEKEYIYPQTGGYPPLPYSRSRAISLINITFFLTGTAPSKTCSKRSSKAQHDTYVAPSRPLEIHESATSTICLDGS